jgi:hypothetical protein
MANAITTPFQVTIEVPGQYLADVLEGAGSRYWCERLRFDAERCDGLTCWEALLTGKIDRVRVIVDPELDPDQRSKRYAVTRASIVRAVQIIRDKYPHHLSAVLGETRMLDASSGDALLQCAALGEIVYG